MVDINSPLRAFLDMPKEEAEKIIKDAINKSNESQQEILRKANRNKTLNKLSALSQKMGMYDE